MLYLFYILLKRFGPQNWWPARTPFEVMVGAILTQNTAWKNVEKAVHNLERAGALDPQSLAHLKDDQLEKLVRPAGFFRVKAVRLKSLAEYLCNGYGGRVEAMLEKPGWVLREELLTIQGIGEETADSILLYALGKPYFVVDAYTRRILSRMGIISDKEAYGRVQRLFVDGLPGDVELFGEFHALLVELGKRHCRASVPLCRDCPVALDGGGV